MGMLENWEDTIKYKLPLFFLFFCKLLLCLSFSSVLDVWFPWMTRSAFLDTSSYKKKIIFSSFDKQRKEKLLRMHVHPTLRKVEGDEYRSSTLMFKEKLLPSSIEKIEKHNDCDLQLFEKGKGLFRKQIQFMIGNGILLEE